MEILHIIPAGASSLIPLAEVLHREDKTNTHTFLVCVAFQTVLKSNIELLKIRDLQFMPIFGRMKTLRKILYLRKRMNAADRIVWHSLRTNDGYSPFFLKLFPKIRKKSVWIPAEGEIGNHMSVSNRLLNRYASRVTRFVQNNVGWVGTATPSDMEIFRGNENRTAELVCLPTVMTAEQMATLERARTMTEEPPRKTACFVQVGQSSLRVNGHDVLLKALKRKEDAENACVCVPFRYALRGTAFSAGTKVYMNQIRATGKKMPYRCFYPLKTVEEKDYLKLLHRMDIVLLGNSSTCQMGMLLCQLAMKKRIFLPESSPLYSYLNEKGAGVYSLDQFRHTETLEELMELPGSCLPDEVLDTFRAENAAAQWIRFFQNDQNR